MFSLNFFKKDRYEEDAHLYWTDDDILPIEMENQYRSEIEKALANWIQQDIQTASLAQVNLEACVSYELSHVDIKFLPFTGSKTRLLNILRDNSVYSGATRFFDVINYICLLVPPSYLNSLRKRFMYSQAFLMPTTLATAEGDVELPTYRQWYDFLQEFEWVIFLPLLQAIYDEDAAILKLKELS